MSGFVLENSRLRCEFLPSDGGRLVSLLDKLHGDELIWNNPRTCDLPRYYGANYDNMSAGGVEEAFPTGLADVFQGDDIPFFGEVWSIPWKAQHDAMQLQMECYSAIYPVRITKCYTLEENRLICSYILSNLADRDLPFLFGVHPSLSVKPGDTVLLDRTSFHVGVADNMGAEITMGQHFTWPMAGSQDLSDFFKKHEKNACMEFRTYELQTGFLGVKKKSGIELHIAFDQRIFPALSVWLIGGGWRGHECLMAEFFTGYPFVLSQAHESGFCPTLSAGSQLKTTVTYTLLGGISYV